MKRTDDLDMQDAIREKRIYMLEKTTGQTREKDLSIGEAAGQT